MARTQLGIAFVFLMGMLIGDAAFVTGLAGAWGGGSRWR